MSEPLKNEHGYPAEVSLSEIAEWDILKTGVAPLIDFVTRLGWNDPVKITRDEDKYIIEFITSGWSGNESLIGALRDNFFWMLYWEESRRGGYYKFIVPAEHWKTKDAE